MVGAIEPKGMGEILVKFAGESTLWADHSYVNFTEWLKVKVENRELLRCVLLVVHSSSPLNSSISELRPGIQNGM
jgi:hypothetical protein